MRPHLFFSTLLTFKAKRLLRNDNSKSIMEFTCHILKKWCQTDIVLLAIARGFFAWVINMYLLSWHLVILKWTPCKMDMMEFDTIHYLYFQIWMRHVGAHIAFQHTQVTNKKLRQRDLLKILNASFMVLWTNHYHTLFLILISLLHLWTHVSSHYKIYCLLT